MRLALRDEGDSRFHGTLGGNHPIAGIWKYDSGRLVLCWRSAAKGYPERFSDEELQDVVTLWRIAR